MPDDTQLLRRFAETRDSEAFAEIVRRHLGWVYGTALRRLAGDTHLAEDAAQIVFTDLARKARTVSDGRPLAGWLHTSTVFAAAKLVRTEQRRRKREEEADRMWTQNQADDSAARIDWDRVRPVLDDALGELKSVDRDALLMRFFQGRAFSEIGTALEVSENGARMRVERAIERLRERLARRGISSSAAALATALVAEASLAPPAALTTSILHGALAAGAAASTAAGTGSILTSITMSKIQATVAALALASGATTVAVQQQRQSGLETELAALHEQNAQRQIVADENQALAQAASEARAIQLERAELERLRLAVVEARTRRDAAANVTANTPRKPGAIQTIRVGPLGGTDAFDISALDEKPQPQERPAPKYPFELKVDGVPGTVALSFVVDEEGKVIEIEPLDSTHPAFTASALEAVSQWKFTPGQKNGLPVRTRMKLPIQFSITDPKWF